MRGSADNNAEATNSPERQQRPPIFACKSYPVDEAPTSTFRTEMNKPFYGSHSGAKHSPPDINDSTNP
jgi:hypothetical protein